MSSTMLGLHFWRQKIFKFSMRFCTITPFRSSKAWILPHKLLSSGLLLALSFMYWTMRGLLSDFLFDYTKHSTDYCLNETEKIEFSTFFHILQQQTWFCLCQHNELKKKRSWTLNCKQTSGKVVKNERRKMWRSVKKNIVQACNKNYP